MLIIKTLLKLKPRNLSILNKDKARLLIEEAFYNKKANISIKALAQRVWNQYKLWRYPMYQKKI